MVEYCGEGDDDVIKALMIDVDGVLLSGRPHDGRHWAASFEADLGLSFEMLQDAFFKRYWKEIVTGRADLRERLAGVLALIAPALTAEQVLTYWFQQDARLNRELLDDLATLRLDGLRVYLATNQEHERARYLMNTIGLAQYVDGCYYSAAIGHRKPASEFFDLVAFKVGLPPRELLLIDDAEENVRAALQIGWYAVQWTGRERLRGLLTRISGNFPPIAGRIPASRADSNV
jgi:putative hydrolase of the HAD superfamily